MIEFANQAEREALVRTLQGGYMEIFPTATIEERLGVLEQGAYVAVTCSPTKGMEETLAITERLARQGFRVVPHLAAKMIRDNSHLREVMCRLDDLPVDSVFVPGGDARQPLGEFSTAFELLSAIAQFDHRFTEIGIAAHPEGHPKVDNERLLQELEKKQPLATYLVTQMCFDPLALERWLMNIRDRGIRLPAWIGIPGVADRGALLRTSMRIGVGESLRFLKRKGDAVARLMKARSYTPDALLSGLAHCLVNPAFKIDGFHIFCFNLVERTEAWRNRAIKGLQRPEAAVS